MGQIDEAVAEVERLAKELLPRCFELRSVQLAPVGAHSPSPTPFAIVVRVVKRSDEPEPGGWAYELAQRVRQSWQRDDFQLSIREDVRGDEFPASA